MSKNHVDIFLESTDEISIGPSVNAQCIQIGGRVKIFVGLDRKLTLDDFMEKLNYAYNQQKARREVRQAREERNHKQNVSGTRTHKALKT